MTAKPRTVSLTFSELEYEMSRRSVPVHALPVPIRLSLYARSVNATPGTGGGGQRQRSRRLRSRRPDRLSVIDRMSIRKQKQFRSTFSEVSPAPFMLFLSMTDREPIRPAGSQPAGTLTASERSGLPASGKESLQVAALRLGVTESRFELSSKFKPDSAQLENPSSARVAR